jgi:hypothetical protein
MQTKVAPMHLLAISLAIMSLNANLENTEIKTIGCSLIAKYAMIISKENSNNSHTIAESLINNGAPIISILLYTLLPQEFQMLIKLESSLKISNAAYALILSDILSAVGNVSNTFAKSA